MTTRGERSICFATAFTSRGYVTMLALGQRCRAGQSIVLRGGSQAARSRIISQTAEALLERGFSLEVYRNWLDPNITSGFSLLSPALMVFDEELEDPVGGNGVMPNKVIDISSFWDYGQLQSQKKALCTLTWQTTRRKQTISSYLKELGIILQEKKSYVSDSMDFVTVNRITQQVISEIFARQASQTEDAQLPQLFVSAITAYGFEHSVNALVSGYKHFYLLRGDPGSGRSTILARVAEHAAMNGLSTRSFYGPLEPDRLELLLIPGLRTALVGGMVVDSFHPSDHRSLTSLKVLELNDALRKKRLGLFRAEWLQAQQRFDELVELTVKQLTYCKQNNETVAAIYQEFADQPQLDLATKKLIDYVLDYIDTRVKAAPPNA